MTSYCFFLIHNKRTLLAMALTGLFPVLSSSVVINLLIQNQVFFQSLSTGQWLPVFLLSSLTMTLAITPTTLVAIAGGYFIGWLAVPFLLPAYLAASAMGYGLGLLLDGGRLMASLKRHPGARQLSKQLCQTPWRLMILARLSPVLPFAFINLLIPSLTVRHGVFLSAGFIGMLPRTLFSIWMGIKARDLYGLLQQPDLGLTSLIPLLLAIASTAGFVHLIQKAISRRLNSPDRNPDA